MKKWLTFKLLLSKKGITLIEILIYTFLVALTITFIVGILSNFFLFRGFFLTRQAVSRSFPYLLETLQKEIKMAEAIVLPGPKTSSSSLVLEKQGKLLSFGLKDGRIVQEIDKKEFFLTPSSLQITSLTFLHLQQSSKGSSVQIKIEVKYKNPTKLKAYDFATIYQTTIAFPK